MRPFPLLRDSIGLIAVAASIALASPGVNVVQAATPVADRAKPAQCGAAAATPADPQIQAFLAQLRAEHEAREQPPAAAADDDFIVLNNRGYNYGPPRGIELDVIRAEARR